MPSPDSSKKDPDKGRIGISFSKHNGEEEEERYRYSYVPLSLYWLKDVIREFVSNVNFPDALAIAFATFSVSLAFPLFPPEILIPIILVNFALTMVLPLGGLMVMLFVTLMMFIYQAPLLAWIITIFVSISLFLGHKHYRTITFIYAMSLLPFSYLGGILEIPGFIIGILFIGLRRATVSTIAIMIMIAMISGMTGIQNTSPILYDSIAAHSLIIGSSSVSGLVAPSHNATTLFSFIPAFSSALGRFFSFDVSGRIFKGFGVALLSIVYNPAFLLIQIVGWLIVIFAMTNFVIKSRSAYKGTESSLFSFLILAIYVSLASYSGFAYKIPSLFGFFLTPLIIFVLEANNIEVVKSLSVMKQDFLGKFGEVFQELTSGTRETLSDIANYDETKKEMREAILAPIEHREISGAYHVNPAKGILLFGPPGTGKTLLMRALANEIRARFFYVKTSAIVSPFEGESAQTLSKIFSTVRKNAPAILFFDEIDGIATKRENEKSDSSRQLLSTLLAEMDGFQKIEGIVIVGSTNVPNLVDPSLLRPGRFDKIIYMSLPDRRGRAKIFNYYLSKLPVADDISYSKLSEITERYSGADIKNVCDEVARQVADDAVRQRKVLQINMSDLVKVIKSTKPSTTLSSLDKFNRFKVDYERRSHPESKSDDAAEVHVADVVGLDDAKKALYEAIEIPILHPHLVKKYDVKNIKGILLFGPPGTGKTMLMKAVSNELEDVKLIILSGSEISKNGTENALSEIKEAFNSARENSPCVIFIDEIDSMLPSRSSSSESAIHITSEFLQQIDGIKNSNGIVLVGATNRPDKIDDAILRPGRFDKFIFVGPPNKKDRATLFRENLSKAPLGSDVDFDVLAANTEGYTGADIANICREVKMGALEETVSSAEDKDISIKDIIAVIRSVKPSSPSSALGRYMNFISLYGGR